MMFLWVRNSFQETELLGGEVTDLFFPSIFNAS